MRACDLSAHRFHRQCNAGQRRDARRPGAGGIHNLIDRDAFARHIHVCDTPGGSALHADHRCVPLHAHSTALGGVEVATQQLQRPDCAVCRAPRCALHAIHHRVRTDVRRFVHRQFTCLCQPSRVLYVARGAEHVQRRIVVGEKEIADAIVLRIDAGVVRESLQFCTRQERQLHVDRIRELSAISTGRLPRTAHAGFRCCVHHQHIGGAALQHMPRH